MDIIQLEGKRVKICPRSIKAMDESGKTVGVVTGLTRFKDATLRVQSDYFRAVCASGLWSCRIHGVMDRVFISGRKLYYLHDTRMTSLYQSKPNLLDEGAKEHAEKLLYLATEAAQYMTVINVYCK